VAPLAFDGLEREAGEDVRRLDRVFGDLIGKNLLFARFP
jgi:hypothetical protein